MSLTVAPQVNLDALNNLRADKKYFLSSTTGQIKEASIFMRIKCAIGVSSARQKVSNLIDAVRNSLLNAAKLDNNVELENDIKGVDLEHMVKGSVIKDIAKRFSVKNADMVAKTHASGIIAREAFLSATTLAAKHHDLGDMSALMKIIKHALKPQLDGPFPMKDEGGVSVLDADAFRSSLHDARIEAEALLDEIATQNPAGGRIDNLYAGHIIKMLFNEDGTRNDNTVESLKTKIEAQFEYVFLDKKCLGSKAESVYDRLVEIGKERGDEKFPVKMLEKVLGYCGDDVELRDFVLEIVQDICVDSNNFLRSDDDIKDKIDAIKANLDEMRTIEKEFPGYMKMSKPHMLDAPRLPNGIIAKMVACVKNAKIDKLASLNTLSSADRIYEGIEELRMIYQEFGRKVDLEMGAPLAIACRGILTALAMSKAGPGFMARLPNIIKGTEFGKMQSFVGRLKDDLKDGLVVTDGKKERQSILESQYDACGVLWANAVANIGEEINPGAYDEEDISYDDKTVGCMIGTLSCAVKNLPAIQKIQE